MKSPVGFAACHAASSSFPSSVISPLRRTAVATLRCDVSGAAAGAGGAAGGVCAVSDKGSAERDTMAKGTTLRRISHAGSQQYWTDGALDWFSGDPFGGAACVSHDSVLCYPVALPRGQPSARFLRARRRVPVSILHPRP